MNDRIRLVKLKYYSESRTIPVGILSIFKRRVQKKTIIPISVQSLRRALLL